MKLRCLLLLSLTACGGVSLITIRKAPLPQKGRCGVERWAVKTLSDPGAQQVNFSPQSTTISYLRQLPAPKVLPTTRLTAERQTYVLSGSVVAVKEESDRDYHLVLSDHGQTMIAEVPNPSCLAHASSTVVQQITAARKAVVQALGQPSTLRFKTVNKPVTVTGVLFWDFSHGQRGVAPNAIELHPVLHISFTGKP